MCRTTGNGIYHSTPNVRILHPRQKSSLFEIQRDEALILGLY
jgi:hypothetical protein